MNNRIGHAVDTHPLVAGRPLILGGVNIDYPYGLQGHSDADCVFHAIAEAIIGALGLGDLGTHFPDSDCRYKGMNSSFFVTQARLMMEKRQYRIANLDVTVFLERPFLQPYKPLMRDNIAGLLNVSSACVNIKATRGEGLGFIGRGEGITAACVVLLYREPLLVPLPQQL